MAQRKQRRDLSGVFDQALVPRFYVAECLLRTRSGCSTFARMPPFKRSI